MAMGRSLQFGTSVFALLLGAVAPLSRALAQNAGSVGAVNPSATGTPPGGSARSLALGTSVVRGERLQTSATGTLHVTFNDRTTLNLGPSTSMTIDRYVYDPASGEGSMQASLRSGLMRYVGGQTSHDGNASVKTPVATIGIRGNMVVVGYDRSCGWRITSLAPGSVSVANGAGGTSIERPGFTTCVSSFNAPIPEPVRADPANIETAFAVTTSRPGQTGGAARIPTESQAGRRGLGSVPLPSNSGSPLDYLSIFSIQNDLGRNAAQGQLPGRTIVQGTPAPGGGNSGSGGSGGSGGTSGFSGPSISGGSGNLRD
jgi:hypothetical protein